MGTLDVSLEKKRSKMPDLRFGNALAWLKSRGLDSDAVLQLDREGSIIGGVGSAAWYIWLAVN